MSSTLNIQGLHRLLCPQKLPKKAFHPGQPDGVFCSVPTHSSTTVPLGRVAHFAPYVSAGSPLVLCTGCVNCVRDASDTTVDWSKRSRCLTDILDGCSQNRISPCAPLVSLVPVAGCIKSHLDGPSPVTSPTARLFAPSSPLSHRTFCPAYMVNFTRVSMLDQQPPWQSRTEQRFATFFVFPLFPRITGYFLRISFSLSLP